MKRIVVLALAGLVCALVPTVASASVPGGDVRLTHDANDPGYVSSYTLATGTPYTDNTLNECSRAHGRQNEPAVAIDPRNTDVILGSSNDYCGVYNATDDEGNPAATGPIWLGYYRSQNAGESFVSSLVPGYPDDTSPYGETARRQIRTASAGDPVIAWDARGRAFFGSESSDDPAGTPKTVSTTGASLSGCCRSITSFRRKMMPLSPAMRGSQTTTRTAGCTAHRGTQLGR